MDFLSCSGDSFSSIFLSSQKFLSFTSFFFFKIIFLDEWLIAESHKARAVRDIWSKGKSG